jgi:hypothetical protein
MREFTVIDGEHRRACGAVNEWHPYGCEGSNSTEKCELTEVLIGGLDEGYHEI